MSAVFPAGALPPGVRDTYNKPTARQYAPNCGAGAENQLFFDGPAKLWPPNHKYTGAVSALPQQTQTERALPLHLLELTTSTRATPSGTVLGKLGTTSSWPTVRQQLLPLKAQRRPPSPQRAVTPFQSRGWSEPKGPVTRTRQSQARDVLTPSPDALLTTMVNAMAAGRSLFHTT